MKKDFFGTDGIRGPAGEYPLNQVGAAQIGKAVATYFAQPGELIVVGCDPRESSPMLAEAVIEGLLAAGARVEDAGILPTPGLSYLTKQRGARAGVMITASHNLYMDNGIKVFNEDGGKLPDGVEDRLNELIAGTIPDRPGGSRQLLEKAVTLYQEFLVACAEKASFQGLRIAIDSANGATSGIAERIFRELGADVMPLFDKPDGRNINVACGATDTRALQEVVKQQHLDIGIAFDGDGDRVIVVDDRGRELSGDHLLYILALTGQHRGVVATIMSNMGLETALKDHGMVLHRTAVGDRYVLEGLAKTGLTLGGEQSGHIILADYAMTGDGLLAAIRTLVQVRASGKTLAQWRDDLPLLPQALINVPLSDRSLLNHPDVIALVSRCSADLDDHGRLNIRPSGTEPKIRVMVEAPDAIERAQVIADQLTNLLDSLVK